MAVQMTLTLVILCFIAQNSALLFHGDNIPGQTTTIGPLGKDATLSLLVHDFLDLKARVISQEQEIQTLKNKKASDDNATVSTVNKLMSEYVDIIAAFGIIKQEFDQNNNQTGLQALKVRQDNLAQSIRYMTLALQDHEIQDEETNKTIFREFEDWNLKLTKLESTTNKTITNILQNLQNEITNSKLTESADIHRIQGLLTTLQTTTQSDIRSVQSKLQQVNDTLFNIFKPNGIRLKGGDGDSGRVEVRFLGNWGTVCDDNFEVEDAKVVCRMLGKTTANPVAYGSAHFGQGTGPIVYDDLGCHGSEADLYDCPHMYIGHHNCEHYEDAGVNCG